MKCLLIIALILLYNPLGITKTINAVSSFSILSDIIKQVGGEHVKVSTLVKPASDPHSFEPSPKDSKLLLQADIVFVNGLGLEGWLDRLVKASSYRGRIIIASRGIYTQQIEEGGNKMTDYHAWNSMKNGVQYATNIMNALIAADPQDANYFFRQGTEYIQQLKKLDLWAKTQFAAIPLQKRRVLTSHYAFGYFGREYGITFLAPIGFSTEAEANARNIANLIKQIKKEKLSAYFIESQTDSRLVKQIAANTGAKAGGELYPEALSDVYGPAATYLQSFKHNVNMLLSSMQ
ncbi:zinc/manganese transport system substrate-binding protein [Serratia symbiotica str. 'Cinara cedri']|nr:zinc/manganese transport system substrate-binding protein [Serratia symbiotica str. 'Cinara cedri']